jgi:4'-phosphopantetheinyl transferase
VISWAFLDADKVGLEPRELPPGVFAPDECERIGRFPKPRRRAEWMLGRWSTKLLVQAWARSVHRVDLALDEIVVASEENGAPALRFSGDVHLLAPVVSLSHCGHFALAALSDEAGACLGVDLERVEARPAAFARDWFSQREMDWLSRLPEGDRDVWITVLWCAREAVVKALGVGLTVSTKDVPCEAMLPNASWAAFRVVSDALEGASALCGRWRRLGPFVATVAFGGDRSEPEDQPAA